jgi:hypothetical protein
MEENAMKNGIAVFLFILLLNLLPHDLFAKTICYQGGGSATGRFWYLTGGKISEKPFSGYESGLQFHVPVWASILQDDSGNYYFSSNNPHNPAGNAFNAWFTATGLSTGFMSGQADLKQDGVFDGSFTITEISCSSVP